MNKLWAFLKKMIMKNIILLLAFVTLILSCEQKQKTQFDLLFENVFKIVRSNYIKKSEVNWVEVEKSVKDSIKIFRNNNDVHNAIKYTLDCINDDHGFFLKSNENIFSNDTLKVPEVQSEIIDKEIGYIKIPGFGANDSLSTLFALNIRKVFKDLDETYDLSGWIIDLSDNNGGAGYTLPLGILPLFQDSVIGYNKDNKGEIEKVTCINNVYKVGGRIHGSITYDCSLKNRNKKIAVLINDKTASCGESVALALRFQGGKTQIFGQRSCGLTTRLIRIDFNPSGAVLFLSTQFMCDLDQNIISGPIIPDIECTPDKSLNKAIKWIKNDI